MAFLKLNFQIHPQDRGNVDNWRLINRSQLAQSNDRTSNDFNSNRVGSITSLTQESTRNTTLTRSNPTDQSTRPNAENQSQYSMQRSVSADSEQNKVLYGSNDMDTYHNNEAGAENLTSNCCELISGNMDCEYLKMVIEFKRTLVIPDAFFSYDIPICYCALCLTNTSANLLKGN